MKKALAAAVGLVLGTGVLRLTIPAPDGGIYWELPRIRSECEVLFVGPSYVNSQVFPDIVDKAARDAGRALTSCKFAQMHMKSFEMKRELDILLSEPWAKLRLVLVDVTLGADTGFNPDNRFKRRILRWHTWDLLPWFFEHQESQRFVDHSREQRVLEHFQHIVLNTLLVGQGAEHLGAQGKPKVRPKLFPTSKSVKEKRLDMNKLEAMSKRRIPKLIARRRTRVQSKERVEWILELRGLVRGYGIEGDALFAPTWSGRTFPRRILPSEDHPVIHAFNDPEKYPELYAVGRHKQDNHLTNEGALAYSELLGHVVAGRLQELE